MTVVKSFAQSVEQKVPHPENVQSEGILTGVVVIVEVYPDIVFRAFLDDQMVASDISMFQPVAMEKTDGLEGLDQLPEDVAKEPGQIGRIIHVQRIDVEEEVLARHSIQNADEIALRVQV